jgi:hypothetical protein
LQFAGVWLLFCERTETSRSRSIDALEVVSGLRERGRELRHRRLRGECGRDLDHQGPVRDKFQYASKAVAQTGTYTTSGSSLVVKSSTSTTGETDSYCVQGSTLTISSTTSTEMTGVSASVVLTKS